jgi:signal transduction histidine kinase
VSATEIESRKQEEERVQRENVRLEERTRIAQELHDTLLQTFLSASMQLSVAVDGVPAEFQVKPLLDRVLRIMTHGIEEGRNTIQDLRSTDTHPFDLVAALSGIRQELAADPNVDFHVVVADRQQPLEPLIQHEIYRIGREALVNAFCHSQAKGVKFELEYADHELRMRISDNGCGIGPQVLQSGRRDIGAWQACGSVLLESVLCSKSPAVQPKGQRSSCPSQGTLPFNSHLLPQVAIGKIGLNE